MKHDNILPMYGYFHDKDHVYLILEYSLHGSTYDEMNKQPNQWFLEPKVAIIIQ